MAKPSGEHSPLLSSWWGRKPTEDISGVVGQGSTARDQSASQTERDGRRCGNLRHRWRGRRQSVFQGVPRQTHHHHRLRTHVSPPLLPTQTTFVLQQLCVRSYSCVHLGVLWLPWITHCLPFDLLRNACLWRQAFIRQPDNEPSF